MPSEAIQPFDLQRMFLGDESWVYLLEIVFRTVFIYGYTLLLIRFLSRRAVGQLSLVEFLLVIALGSAVGDPMFQPDVPLVHAMVVISVVVLLNRTLDRGMAFPPFGKAIEGHTHQVVKDGLIQVDRSEKLAISPRELFFSLRVNGVENLGAVKGAYMEPSGHLSVFCFSDRDRPKGLILVPPWDVDPPDIYNAGTMVESTSIYGCTECGHVQEIQAGDELGVCPRCQKSAWTDRVG